MKPVTKRWSALVQPNEWWHFARFQFRPERQSSYHTHDFAEVFWIQHGQASHFINGSTKLLRPGDLILIRPGDCHVLAAVDADGFELVNLAFDRRVYAGLRRRWPEEFNTFYPARHLLPYRAELSPAQQAGLMSQVEQLARGARRRVALEHFLLGLFLLLHNHAERSRPVPPDWLAAACDRLRDPAYFRLGAAGLVKASGRSAEHVARTVRVVLGETPSVYVNRIRLAHAATELRVTARSILDIALDCGWTNLSHFYALFRTAYGITPRRYRINQQRQVL